LLADSLGIESTFTPKTVYISMEEPGVTFFTESSFPEYVITISASGWAVSVFFSSLFYLIKII
jgi:hypothetical protein